MDNLHTWFVSIGLSLALLGCGGGGGSTSVPVTSAPPVSGSSTATLGNSQQDANELVAITKTAAGSAVAVSGFSVLPVGGAPSAAAAGPVRVQALAVQTSGGTHTCSLGGTGAYTIRFSNSAAPSAGDVLSFTFTNCSEVVGLSESGQVDVTLSRWNSDQDFAFGFAVTGLTAVDNGQATGPYTFSGQYAYANSQATWSYTVNHQTVIGDPVLTRGTGSTTINSGTVRANLGAGYADFAFAGWRFDQSTGRASAGTVSVTGASGQAATISPGDSGYQVELNLGGTKTTYTVAY
jgi:hypothetical protein